MLFALIKGINGGVAQSARAIRRDVGQDVSKVKGDKGFVYILQSQSNGSYYVGSTQNYLQRLRQHQDGRSKYTRGRGPWTLVYVQEYATLKTARKIENKLKQMHSRKIIEKIVNSQKITMGA